MFLVVASNEPGRSSLAVRDEGEGKESERKSRQKGEGRRMGNPQRCRCSSVAGLLVKLQGSLRNGFHFPPKLWSVSVARVAKSLRKVDKKHKWNQRDAVLFPLCA